MTISKLDKNDYILFAVFSGIFVFLGWIGFLAALGGFFYSWILGGFFLLMFAIFLRQIILKKISLKISKEFLIVFLAIAAFAAASSFFAAPTVFSGRDQGSLSEAAVRLSDNHRLEFSNQASREFFKIYGEGKALNFPGFHYDSQGQLATQFPIGYISWLAIFYSFFGLSGLVIANSAALFFFLLAFYLILRIFIKTRFAFFALILAATSFPIFWFQKFTLSENFALALLWMSILGIILFLKEKNNFNYFSFLVPAGLLVFTRIEGIFFLFSGALVLFFLAKKDAFWKRNRKIIFIYPAIFFFLILILNFTKGIHFYEELAKAIIRPDKTFGQSIGTIVGRFLPVWGLVKVYYIYGLLSFFLLSLISIARFFRKKDYLVLVPFFSVLLTLFYAIHPWISTDHPWMLRRFSFSIVPFAVFYAILFLSRWIEEKNVPYRKIIAYFAIISLLSFNLFIFSKYFSFSENKGLLSETKRLSDNFSDSDLVLVDRMASGDGFSMLTGPMNFLYGKNAVYFFNPEDIGKIDRSKFSKIYLLTPDENISFYSEKFGKENLSFVKDYQIETERLENMDLENNLEVSLPQKIKISVKGKIFEII